MKPLDMLAAYMPHIETGNKILDDFQERFSKPLKCGIFGKTPAAINNTNDKTLGDLHACFGAIVRQIEDVKTKYSLLKDKVKSNTNADKKRILKSFAEFSHSYLKTFVMLESFKDTRDDRCKPFCRIHKLVSSDKVKNFVEDLSAAHYQVKRVQNTILGDEEAEKVAAYLIAVAALEDLAKFPQPPSSGGYRKTMRARRRRRAQTKRRRQEA